MYDRWLTDFHLLILVFLCSIFLLKIEPVLCFRWNHLPSFFVLFLVSFDGFILIHMSHFVNTNFVFSCYFSVLFSSWMPAISFHLVTTPSYLFICHHSHIIQPHVNLRLQLLLTHVCPVTEFAVASHLNMANSCCHHVFLRHFRFQKCLPANSTRTSLFPCYFSCQSSHFPV